MVWLAATILRMSLGGALGALAVLTVGAVLTGLRPLAPIRATALWVLGPTDLLPDHDGLTTALGLAAHFVASAGWAMVLLGAAFALGPLRVGALFALGLGVAVVAMVVDYGILPRWMNPAWHTVLSWAWVLAAYAALGLGLAAGGVWARLSVISPPPVGPKSGPA